MVVEDNALVLLHVSQLKPVTAQPNYQAMQQVYPKENLETGGVEITRIASRKDEESVRNVRGNVGQTNDIWQLLRYVSFSV